MSTIQNGLTRTDKMTIKRCMGWLPGRLAGTQMWPWSNLPREPLKFFTSGKQQRYFHISRTPLPNSANQKSFTQNFLEWNSLPQHFCSQQNMTPPPCRGTEPVPFRKAAPVLWLQPTQIQSLHCLSAWDPASLQNVKLRPRKLPPAFENYWPPPLCRDCRHLPCL